jgi:SAM-dependent methyltransferase
MPAPDPSRIIDALSAYWQTAAIRAAIDLGVFTALGRRARTASQIAADCGADAAALGRLCDSLVSLGLLRARKGRYRSTAEAARFLDARSPDSLASLPRFFDARPVTTAFTGLAATVRRGSSVAGVASRIRFWRGFAAATFPLRRRAAIDIADELQRRRLVRGRILDVGAGASPLGIELLSRARQATLVVQDRSPVVRVAIRQAGSAGVGDRVAALPGDALWVEWGGPFDLILMMNVIDYFGAGARARLVRKAHAALRPGGVLAVSAPFLNESRTSPPEAVFYDLLLLALEAEGQASTPAEMRRLLGGARFSPITRCRGLPLMLGRRRPR